MSAKRKLLESWYQTVWNDGDLSKIGDFFAPDVEAGGILPDLLVDQEDFKELVATVRPLIDDLNVTVLHSIEQGDWLSALVEVSGASSQKGAPIRVFSQVMIRVEDNRIAEAYYGFDTLTFFEQLGQLPPDTLPQLLSGTFMR